MDDFLLTPDEARVRNRHDNSPLRKLCRRLPQGSCWQELTAALSQRRKRSGRDNRRQIFLVLSLFCLGRRITDRLLPFSSARNFFLPEGELTLYHWFPAECRARIQVEGLRPGPVKKLVFMTDDPDFPNFSPYFCQKVLEAGRDIRFCPVRIDAERLSCCQQIYRTHRSYEYAVKRVPPECLDFYE